MKPYLHRSELGEKVVRNKYQPCNENPTSAGWDFCLQFSVQFSLRNWKLLAKLHSVKAPLPIPVLRKCSKYLIWLTYNWETVRSPEPSNYI